jgi:hypothetical protein
MLGNLSITEIENRVKVNFPEELKVFLKESHQARADNIQKGKWHCFDIPFNFVCGDLETAKTVYKHLKDVAGDFAQQMEISIST